MSIRVVARIRPQHSHELSKDSILSTSNAGDATFVSIPNPKNHKENYSFQFSNVFDQGSSQQELFDQEISPTIKHLFNGFDVTVFAYGSTGTGKTHTMRGGKSLAERGIIPRLLSGVYRRARRIMKDSEENTKVDIMLSYFEIYNDKVYDLFEPPDQRSAAGLPLRDNGGKTVVVGLTERPCQTLREFERLYDEANINRSTSATKLNASSSRSHAILRLNLVITTPDTVRISTASAIDLAGSEDNRRTENNKERMVESASINKSLFTLAKCAEAISKGDARIPYRESKMTRILSLGVNKGLTVMVLNLSPMASYHLDSLSSLTFANRTKKIEVREVENEPVFKGCARPVPSVSGTTVQRQPLRPLQNGSLNAGGAKPKPDLKSKAFAVYSDRIRPSGTCTRPVPAFFSRRSSPLKRPFDNATASAIKPAKRRAPNSVATDAQPRLSKQIIEDMVERKVTDVLAARALDQPSIAPAEISEEVQRRLEMLEKKIEGKDDGREQGLSFLLMAKQHAVRGEDASALRMYTLARDFFPHNERLEAKIERLRNKLGEGNVNGDNGQQDTGVDKKVPDRAFQTQRLLEIINSRDIRRIRTLKGVGTKKAEAILDLLGMEEDLSDGQKHRLTSLEELSDLKGVGAKAVESMMTGLSS